MSATSRSAAALIALLLAAGAAAPGVAAAGFLDGMWESRKLELGWRTMTYGSEPEGGERRDGRSFQQEARLELGSRWSVGDNSFGLAAWAEAGTREDTYSQAGYSAGLSRADPERERGRRHLELNELYWIRSLGEVDLTLGRTVLRTGSATLFSPADRLCPEDLTDPLEARRLGVWLASLDWYRGDTVWTLAVVPLFSPARLPAASSRWAIFPDLEIPAAFRVPEAAGFDPTNLPAEVDYPSGADAVQVLVRAKANLPGWDIFVAALRGVGHYPVLRSGSPGEGEGPLVQEYVPESVAAAGASTTAGQFEFHGEAVARWSRGGRDDDCLTWVAGLTFTDAETPRRLGLERLELTVDYVGEELLEQQDRAGYLAGTDIFRRRSRGVTARMTLTAGPDLAVGALVTWNPGDGGRAWAPGLEYRLADGLTLRVAAEFLGGPADSLLGGWDRNDRLVTALRYAF